MNDLNLSFMGAEQSAPVVFYKQKKPLSAVGLETLLQQMFHCRGVSGGWPGSVGRCRRLVARATGYDGEESHQCQQQRILHSRQTLFVLPQLLKHNVSSKTQMLLKQPAVNLYF